MNTSFIIANWKLNKTLMESREWIKNFLTGESIPLDKKVIICPSFILLSDLKSLILGKNLKIEIGAQNLSSFETGEYTGEVSAAQIKDYANYVLIGHSERRNNFNETNQTLDQKVKLAKKYNLEPIYCIQGKDTYIPKGVKIVAFEPLFAIGTGNPDTPEDVEEVGKIIKHKGVLTFLYGGSVNPENVNSFTSMSSVDGALVGKASLDPLEFGKIIKFA